MKTKFNTCLLPILLLAAFCYETNPFANQALGDCTWFAYMGRMWLHGHVPFLEYFDHKGPMIFFINMIGLGITETSYLGVWIIEMIFMSFSIITIYSYLRETCDEIFSVVVVSFITALWLKWVSPCDNIESFAYPVVIYAYLRFILVVRKDQSINGLDAFLFGLTFMFLFMLKANLVCVAFVVAIFYIHELIKTKDVGRFCKNSVATIAGMLLIFAPIVIYFYIKDALYDLWFCSIEFNIKYASESACFNNLLYFVVAVNIVNFVLLFIRKQGRRVLAYNQLFLFLTGLTLWHCPTYDHYYAMILPGLLPLFVELRPCVKTNVWMKWIIGFCLYVICIVILMYKVLTANFDLAGLYQSIKSGESILSFGEHKEGSQFSEVIPFLDLIKDRNSVLCFGKYGLYEYLKVTTRFKYFLHTTGALSEDIRIASLKNLMERNDRYVIAYKENVVGEWECVLYSGYDAISESPNFILFERKK